MKIKPNQLLIVILLLNILIRLPSLFDPVSYGDECIYLALGKAFNRGLVFYRDIHDNKPPFLYLVAALAGGKQIWFRVITIFWTTVNVYFIYLIAKTIFKKEWLRILTALFFVILAILPEGRIPNGENYMIMPLTVGVWLLLVKQAWFWTGVAISIGFLFKVPVGFDFIGIVLAYFIFKPNSIKKILLVFREKKIYLVVAGFVLPIALLTLYYWSKGAFEPFFRSALMQNIGYLSSWSGNGEKTSFIVRNRGLVTRALILLVITVVLYLRKRRLGFYFTFFSVWFGFALFGVLLSERPYPHYLIELIPPGVFLLVLILTKIRLEKMFFVLFFIFLTVFSCRYYNFWWYPIIPYYQNFARFALGEIDKNQYFSYFGNKTLNDYEVSAYVKTHSFPDERIFVWGDGACIYALSERTPPGRYTVNYHIFDFNGFTETLTAINQKQPNIIIKLDSEKQIFTELNKLLSEQYLPIKTIGEAQIFHRIK